jgi:catecholate siderophore receptor
MEPQIASAPAGTPLADLVVNRALQGGHSRETFFQNQMDLLARFTTGPIEHNLAAGWEAGPESSKPTYRNAVGVPSTSLLDPDEDQAFSGTIFPRVKVSTTAFTVGAYVIDTAKLGNHWELSGGVRWDRFDSDYQAQFYSNVPGSFGTPTTHNSDHEVDKEASWRASLVYKPTKNGTIYFDFSTSFNPSAEALSQIVAVRSFNQGNIGLPPEKNRTFELGTKWNLLSQKLQLQAAIFREEKTNARIPDPNNPGFNILGGDQRVDGGEIELAGQITQDWQVTASYTHLGGKVVKSGPGGPPVGIGLFDAPKNSAALWTTYQLPLGIQIGGGLNYVSRRYGQITKPFERAPGYTVLDAMVKWQATPHIRLQVNVNNITNKYYYDELHGFHIIPGEGRAALFTIAFTG